MSQNLERLSVSAARITGDLEPLDPELLMLIAAADDADTLLPKEAEVSNKTIVDNFEPLSPSSTPMAVNAFNIGFSHLEVLDLMNLFAPETLKMPTFVQSYLEPIKKISKRSKKCTYAARRREVAFLRQELVVLEIRLNEMRKNQFVSRRTREQADRETYTLAKSQEENQRLRALVSSQEAMIRQADAYMVSVNHPQQSESSTRMLAYLRTKKVCLFESI
ncbi:unnamed protein product [Peronospora destructor]|uniref:BZIP domain-containing protein n=1 Tax=Peronospora destructor TaxID=86335 RepID=A0AAV0SZV2_9STRA|nr:unnamed protein product [Peronospora destructor]